MKKTFFSIVIIISIISICVFTLFIIRVVKEDKIDTPVAKASKDTKVKLDDVQKDHGYYLYRPEQTKRVKNDILELTSNEHSDESAIIEDMHDMTHQKVQAEFKESALEMTPEHVNTLYEIVSKSSFPHKAKFLAILQNWKKKNFKDIVEEHNFLWEIQGGTYGKATDRLTTREEKEFINNNFR